MAETIIYKIKDVRVGDIVYYNGSEKGARVVGVDLRDEDNSRLSVETPEVFKPFTAYKRASVWLQDSYFHHAIRHTQNKSVEKSLPEVRDGNTHVFETTSGARIIYDGAWFHGWSIESFHSDERLLELLDPSQFPLKDITEKES